MHFYWWVSNYQNWIWALFQHVKSEFDTCVNNNWKNYIFTSLARTDISNTLLYWVYLYANNKNQDKGNIVSNDSWKWLRLVTIFMLTLGVLLPNIGNQPLHDTWAIFNITKKCTLKLDIFLDWCLFYIITYLSCIRHVTMSVAVYAHND